MNVNNVELMGNLTKDPVVRQTKTGRNVASFTVATNMNYTTPNGEKKQITNYTNVVVWGNLALAIQQQLNKGRFVLVQGRLSTRSYDDQNGQKRYVTEVVAYTVAIPLVPPQNQKGYQGMNTQPNGQNGYSGGYNQNFGQWGNGQGGNGMNAAPNNAPNWNQYGPDVQGQQNKDEDIPF